MKWLNKSLYHVAFVCWVCSLFLPLYQKTTFYFWSSENSIISILIMLAKQNRMLFFLIFLSTILFPILKFSLAFLNKNHELQNRIWKYSTTDIFVISISIILLQDKFKFVTIELCLGFYFFLFYCIISLLALFASKYNSKFQKTSV